MRPLCASSTASGPSSAAAITASAAYQSSLEPAGAVKGTSSALNECRSRPQRATGAVTASTAITAAPLSVRRSLTASQTPQPITAASRPPREEASPRPSTSSESVAQPATRSGRAARTREPERRGRRERSVGADRVRVAEHSLEARGGLEEDAVRALLDGVGDERQRGGAEHPSGRLERAAEEVGEQHAAGSGSAATSQRLASPKES